VFDDRFHAMGSAGRFCLPNILFRNFDKNLITLRSRTSGHAKFLVRFKDAWNWFKEAVSDCANAAADAGLKFAFEYKPKETRNFSLIANADGVLRLIDQIKASNMGVLLDTGHALYAKEDLPTTVEKLDKTLFHVHLDDNYGDWDDDLVPGAVHDFTEFFKALRRIDYGGYVSLNIYPMQGPFGECKRSKQYIDEMYSKLAHQAS
jgi:xylose isomerase